MRCDLNTGADACDSLYVNRFERFEWSGRANGEDSGTVLEAPGREAVQKGGCGGELRGDGIASTAVASGVREGEWGEWGGVLEGLGGDSTAPVHLRSPLRQRELEWQAQWFGGRYGRDFVSTAGDQVRVVQFGVWNHASGPDFTDAAICLNGEVLRRGSIELDLNMSDWEGHGHATNPEYNGLILHVCAFGRPSPAFFTRTSNFKNIPQLLLGAPLNEAGEEISSGSRSTLARPGRCALGLVKLSRSAIKQLMESAARTRFERKCQGIARARDAHGGGEALYQSLAKGLGYCGNELPFLLMAQRLPVSFLSRRRSVAPALLLGVAGFIPESVTGLTPGAREEIRGLWKAWWPYRTSVGRSVIDRGLWRTGRQRPNNHPERRVAALAELVKEWTRVVRLSESRDWNALRKLLLSLEHPFWNRQLTFRSKVHAAKVRILGEERVDGLLLNGFLPAMGDWAGVLKMRERGVNRTVRIAAERLLAGREDVAELVRGAVFQQGLMELYEGYCLRDASDCVSCVFPEQGLRVRASGMDLPEDEMVDSS